MSTLYERYITGDDDFTAFWTISWKAQTFTPAIAHTITSVKLLLYRLGSPGTITVGIRATDGSGHPTGIDRCSGTTEGNTLTEDSGGEWREITLGAGDELEADTKYAIVVRISGGDSSNRLNWRMDFSSSLYTGGDKEYSGDSGSSWETSVDNDYMFEDWGEAAVEGYSHNVLGVATASIAKVNGVETASIAAVSGVATA